MANNGKPRRQARTQSPETRAKIGAAVRAKCAARGVLIWDEERKETLRKAFMRGGLRAAYEAFPDIRQTQVRAAVTRYCASKFPLIEQPQRTGSVWDDPDFNRRFHEALTGMSY